MTSLGRSIRTAVPIALGLGGAAALGGLMFYGPGLALAAAALAVLAVAAFRSPDLATFAVVFILYSNLAVVASRFHGVPQVIASAFPLLLLVPLLRDLVLRRQRLVLTPAFPILLVLLAVQVLSMAFSRSPEVSRRTVIEFLLEGFLLYFIVTNVVRTSRALRLSLWALLLAGFVSGIVPCYQQLTGNFHKDYGGLGQTSEIGFRTDDSTDRGGARQLRLAGPIGEQNRYAQNMLMLLPIGFFVLQSERSRRLRLLAALFTGIGGAGFLLAFSRGGAVAFLLVLATMAAMRLVTPRQFILVLAVALLGLVAVPQYWSRLRTIGDVARLAPDAGRRDEEVDSSMKRRMTEMAAAAMVFADHPVIGVGPGMFKYYSQEYGNRLDLRRITETRKAHSLFLEVAAETGTIGLLCFLTLVLVTLYGLIAARRLLRPPPGVSPEEERERREMAHRMTGLFLALVAYLASGLFLHLAYIRFFYLMLGLAGAAGQLAPSPGGLSVSGAVPGAGPGRGSWRPGGAGRREEETHGN